MGGWETAASVRGKVAGLPCQPVMRGRSGLISLPRQAAPFSVISRTSAATMLVQAPAGNELSGRGRCTMPGSSGDDYYLDSDRVVSSARPRVSRRVGHAALLGGECYQSVVDGTAGDTQAAQNGVDLLGARSAQRQWRREPCVQPRLTPSRPATALLLPPSAQAS